MWKVKVYPLNEIFLITFTSVRGNYNLDTSNFSCVRKKCLLSTLVYIPRVSRKNIDPWEVGVNWLLHVDTAVHTAVTEDGAVHILQHVAAVKGPVLVVELDLLTPGDGGNPRA